MGQNPVKKNGESKDCMIINVLVPAKESSCHNPIIACRF